MTLKYCNGNPLTAEAVFGWGRQTVALGLAERRSAIICMGAQSDFSGRKPWKDLHPEPAQALCLLAEDMHNKTPRFARIWPIHA